MANKPFKGVKSSQLANVFYNSPESVAEWFSTSKAYVVGDIVYYGLKLYKFTAAHAAGAWTGSDVEEVTVGGQLKTLNEDTTELKEDLSELSTDLEDTKNSVYITDSASGAIASFEDGADGVPVKDLTVQIEPVQDLHGQANPYPGGGGKNKANYPALISAGCVEQIDGSLYAATPSAISDIAVFQNNGTSGQFSVTFIYKNESTTRGAYPKIKYTDGTEESVPVNTGSTSYVTVIKVTMATKTVDKIYMAYGSNVKTWFYVQVETGDTPTAWTPYSNICPISGWTGANVTRTGKNLINVSAANEARKNGGNLFTLTYSDNNTVEMSTSSVGALNTIWEILKVTPNLVGTYLTRSNSGYSSCYFYKTRDNDGSWIPAPTSYRSTDTTIQLTENDVGHAIGLSFYNDTGTTKTISNVQVEFGQTATAFEPFTGTIYSIDWTTEAGTVYGGTLDVTTGVLTVTDVPFTFGSETWTWFSGADPFFYTTLNLTGGENVSGDYFAENGVDVYITAESHQARIYPSRNSFVDENTDCANLMSGMKLLYTLATPITYQLTPTEVSTLLGLNNIWADCGDTTVDYRADTKLYIEKLTAPTEDDMIANTNIPDATYFMVGNTLYLSTTTIPAGDTINPGTNCTLMNLASALNALNS